MELEKRLISILEYFARNHLHNTCQFINASYQNPQFNICKDNSKEFTCIVAHLEW